MNEPIRNRYEFVILFDVRNGNPNGDPDSNGAPRVDTYNNRGFMTNNCLKRKIRNRILAEHEGEEGFECYIYNDESLNAKERKSFLANGIEETPSAAIKKKDPDADERIREWMCRNYFDVRMFGGVFSTFMQAKFNCGMLKGPVQIGIASSIDEVYPVEMAITRKAITRDEDFINKNQEMGRRKIIPYALYRAEGFISPASARITGFSDKDVEALWSGIMNMFEDDRSSTRGIMTVRKLVIFKHSSALGNCRASRLFDLVDVRRKSEDRVPVDYRDYLVDVREDGVPEGIEITVMD